MSHHSRHLTRLLPVLRHAVAHLGIEQTPTGRRLGLTNARVMALVTVDSTDHCSMSDLARALDLPASLATRVVDELSARSLVKRFDDDADRRRVLLRLTPEGQAAIVAAQAEAEEQISAVIERMSPKETDALVIGLESFLRVLHEPSHGAVVLPDHTHVSLDSEAATLRTSRLREDA